MRMEALESEMPDKIAVVTAITRLPDYSITR